MSPPSASCFCCDSSYDKSFSVVPACGHVFHTVCVETWFTKQKKERKKRTCPTCRADVSRVSFKAKDEHGVCTRATLESRVLYLDYAEELTQRLTSEADIPLAELEEEDEEEEDEAPTGPRPEVALMQAVRDLKRERDEAKVVAQEVEELRSAKATLVAELDAARRDANAVEKALQDDLGAAKQDVARLEEEVEQLQQGQPNLRTEIESLNLTIIELDGEKTALDEALREAEERRKTDDAVWRRRHKNAERTWEREREELAKEKEMLVAERDKFRAKVADAGKGPAERIRKLVGEQKELRTQIEEMERTHAIALAAKDNELSKANDEVASAVATATSVKTSTSDLKAENVRLKSGIQSYENKCNSLKNKIEDLKSQFVQSGLKRGRVDSPPDSPVRNRGSSSHPPPARQRRRMSSESPLPFKLNNSTLPCSAPLKPSPPEADDDEMFDGSDDGGKDEPIVISDTDDEAEDSDELEVAPPPKMTPVISSGPFGRRKPPLEKLRTDKYLPDYAASGKVAERGPKVKPKSRKIK